MRVDHEAVTMSRNEGRMMELPKKMAIFEEKSHYNRRLKLFFYICNITLFVLLWYFASLPSKSTDCLAFVVRPYLIRTSPSSFFLRFGSFKLSLVR